MNAKQNNNEALEQLKNELTTVAKQIPKSEMKLFLDFMENIWAKLFVDKPNTKILDIRSVISYIEGRIRNSRNQQHQAFWAKIYKMLFDMKEKLERI